ncbi:MAG TPA: hypothetical protein VK619_04170 [Pyrinomonadaceae bacterium]|nr:hypothetical protein [Pyrinomonadaceae bacterium]
MNDGRWTTEDNQSSIVYRLSSIVRDLTNYRKIEASGNGRTL